MSSKHTCTFCNNPCATYLNYCSSKCHFDHAKSLGGRTIAPNNLPITCINANGDLLEHEHADHPDYKFPVIVDLIDKINKDPIDYPHTETHALIYSDGFIAITLYECCYYMWHLTNGKSRDKRHSDYKLVQESIDKILNQ